MHDSTRYLADNDVDDVARMLMALLSEFWILRDRVAILEKVLEDSQILTPGQLDEFQPDQELSEHLEQLRTLITSNVIGAPLTAETPDVPTLTEKAKATRSSRARRSK